MRLNHTSFIRRTHYWGVASAVSTTDHQVDVAASTLDDDHRSRLIAIGEAKWNEKMGTGHLDRLRRIRVLLTAKGWPGAGAAQLTCYSGAGVTPKLVELGGRSDEIVLVGLDALYGR